MGFQTLQEAAALAAAVIRFVTHDLESPKGSQFMVVHAIAYIGNYPAEIVGTPALFHRTPTMCGSVVGSGPDTPSTDDTTSTSLGAVVATTALPFVWTVESHRT